ncbi:unnamed protein product, partial [Prorocentrum cordatum]
EASLRAAAETRSRAQATVADAAEALAAADRELASARAGLAGRALLGRSAGLRWQAEGSWRAQLACLRGWRGRLELRRAARRRRDGAVRRLGVVAE